MHVTKDTMYEKENKKFAETNGYNTLEFSVKRRGQHKLPRP